MPVAKGTVLDPARTRAAIVASATELLYERGLDGVGVAELCAAMGMSKETLYRHFGSKDGLIRAVLEARSDRIRRWLRGVVAAAGSDPFDQLAAIFDALAGWYAEPAFRGCAIMNAAAQHHATPVQEVATRHLDGHLELFTGIAVRAGAADPPTVARQLLMLMEGATVLADHHTGSAATTASQAQHAALTLLRAAASSQP